MFDTLLPQIRRRLRLARAVDAALWGCLIGCVAMLTVSLAVVGGVVSMSPGMWLLVAAGCIGGGALIGGLAGWLRPAAITQAASVVDRRYDLKDRTVSTLELNSRGDAAAMHRLQRVDTETHLASVDPAACVPINAPAGPLRWSIGIAAAAASVMAMHLWMARPALARVALPLAAQQSAGLREEMLPELERLADQTEDPVMQELLRELREKVEKLETEPIDESDLLAELSDMQQSLAEARDSLQIEATDEMLASLATAIEPAESMLAASESLREQDYDRAAEQLASVDPEKLTDQERRAVGSNLKRMVDNLGPAKPGSLSANLTELSQNLEAGKPGECKKCLAKIAKACEKQGQCKKCGQCLAKQMDLLAQCKCQCRGQCDSPFARKSDSPSTKAGSAASGDPTGGDPTRLGGTRQQVDVTGTASRDGDSETEILTSPEAQQGAGRGYTAKYKDYKRQAEEVLESEPLPQSHRQTVRNYFEAIRPE